MGRGQAACSPQQGTRKEGRQGPQQKAVGRDSWKRPAACGRAGSQQWFCEGGRLWWHFGSPEGSAAGGGVGAGQGDAEEPVAEPGRGKE